jgi:hypothetical protein
MGFLDAEYYDWYLIHVDVIGFRESALLLVIPAKFREGGRAAGSRMNGAEIVLSIPDLGRQERPRPE